MNDDSISQKTEKKSKEQALLYMKTLVDVARESFLILDSKLRVIEGNPTFYQSFQVLSNKTENVLLYELGNGQWNIPELRKLLEEILPEKKEIRGYEVTHTFETIGKKTIVLNVKQIDSVQLIILAMEDITVKKDLENKVAKYTKGLEIMVVERTKMLENQLKKFEVLNKTMVGRELKMIELKKEISNLKKLIKNRKSRDEN
jgi:hypothetical protein